MVKVKQWPLWVRYVIALSCGAIIVVALVLYVNDHQQPLSEAPASASKSQEQTEQRQDTIIVEQQQAPHVAKASSKTAAVAAAAAVTAYMSREVSHGFISGPLDGTASCSSRGGSSARRAFSCRVTSGQKATKLEYPFDAVVQTAAAKVTYCQVVTPPIPSMKEPAISSACR